MWATFLAGIAVDAVVVLSASDTVAIPPAHVPAPPARGTSGALLLRIHCLFHEYKDQDLETIVTNTLLDMMKANLVKLYL